MLISGASVFIHGICKSTTAAPYASFVAGFSNYAMICPALELHTYVRLELGPYYTHEYKVTNVGPPIYQLLIAICCYH